MSLCLVLFAQIVESDDLAVQSRFMRSLPQSLAVLGALVGVSLLAFFWVVLVRKRRRRRRHRHHPQPAIQKVREQEDQKKRRRRDRRPRNPTLAETRGLPPVRDGEAFPPSD
jgi:flagellar biosynthesis/type III secretory pathway M-ring protein FliF/YscJ